MTVQHSSNQEEKRTGGFHPTLTPQYGFLTVSNQYFRLPAVPRKPLKLRCSMFSYLTGCRFDSYRVQHRINNLAGFALCLRSVVLKRELRSLNPRVGQCSSSARWFTLPPEFQLEDPRNYLRERCAISQGPACSAT